MRRTQYTADERFFAKVALWDACWIWTAYKDPAGYGQFWDGGKMRAHRWAYEQEFGPIPEGYTVDHTCHVRGECTLGNACPHRACTNPEHLEAVPLRENLLRGNTNMAKTHCKRDHLFTEENTYHIPSGGRACRLCQHEHERTYRMRRA